MNIRSICSLWTALLGSLVLAATARSAGVWTGDIDGDWGNALNWDDGNVPGAGADVTFPDVGNQAIVLNGERTSGTLTFNAPDGYTLSGSTLTPGTNMVQSGAGAVTINSAISLATNLTFMGTGAGTVTVNGAISGTLATRRVTVDVTNHVVVLAGTNSYSGGTTLTNGTLLVTGNNTASVSPNAFVVTGTSYNNTLILGSASTTPLGSGDWYAGASANLRMMSADSSTRIVSNRYSAYAPGSGKNYLTVDGTGNVEFRQGIHLNFYGSEFYLTVNNPTTTLAQVSGRAGTVHKQGPGTLVISGTNTLTSNVSFRHYEGIVVLEGTFTNFAFSLQTDRASSNKTFVLAYDPLYAWGTTSTWYQGSVVTNAFRSADTNERSLAGVIAAASPAQYFYSLYEGPGNIRLINGMSAAGYVTLYIENPRTIVEKSLVVSGAAGVSLTKRGSGILEIATNCVAAKMNTVAAGTLLVNGQITTNTAMAVSTGATLGGFGSIGQVVTVSSNAVLSPGDNGIGVLSVTNLIMNTNSVYVWEYNNDASDRCDVAGTLTLRGTKPATLRMVDGGEGTINLDDEFVLFTYTGADPVNPAWVFEYVGTRWGNCNPVVTVDAGSKRVVLSGLLIPSRGSVILFK